MAAVAAIPPGGARSARRRWCVRRWRVRRWRVRRWRVRRVRERRFDRGVRCRSPIVRVRCRSPIVRVQDFSPRAVPPPAGPSAQARRCLELVRRSRGGGGDVRAYRRWFRRVLGGRFRPRRGRRGHASFAARSSTLCDVLFRFRRSIGRRRSRIPGGADPPAGSTLQVTCASFDWRTRFASRRRDWGTLACVSSRRWIDAEDQFIETPPFAISPRSAKRTTAMERAMSRAMSQARAGFRKRLRTGFRKRLRTGFRDPRYPRDPRTRTRKYSSACSARCANTAARWPARDRARTIRVGPGPDGPGADLATCSSARDGTPHASPASGGGERKPANAAGARESTERLLLAGCRGEALSLATTRGCGRTRYCWPRRRNANSPPSRRRWRAACRPGTPCVPSSSCSRVCRVNSSGPRTHDTKRSHRRRSSRRSSSSLARTRRHLSVERRAGRSRGARRLGRRALDRPRAAPPRDASRRPPALRRRSSVGARVFGGRGPPTVSSNAPPPTRFNARSSSNTPRGWPTHNTCWARFNGTNCTHAGFWRSSVARRRRWDTPRRRFARRDRSIADRGSATRRRSPRRRRSWNIACEAT